MARSLARNALAGAVAGACGTLALDVATYVDMTARGRAASQAPADLVGTVAEERGIGALAKSNDSEEAANRRGAVGSLVGYAMGVTIGAVAGVLRGAGVRVPVAVAASVLGVVAMAAADLPLAAEHVSDPSQWRPADWAADAVPHLVYGVVVALLVRAAADR